MVMSYLNNYCNVSLKYIKAHTGLSDELSKGNEGADRLAGIIYYRFYPIKYYRKLIYILKLSI